MKKKHGMGPYDVGGSKRMKVSMAPAGNVKVGAYSTGSDGKSLAACNGTFNQPSRPAGHHRTTLSVGKPKGHHRSG